MPPVSQTVSGSGPSADSGLEGCEKHQSEGLGDGQYFDGDDPLLGTDGAGRKRKQCKNLLPERKGRKRKTTITMVRASLADPLKTVRGEKVINSVRYPIAF